MRWLWLAVTLWASIALLLAVLLGRAFKIANLQVEEPSGSPVPDCMPDPWTSTTRSR